MEGTGTKSKNRKFYLSFLKLMKLNTLPCESQGNLVNLLLRALLFITYILIIYNLAVLICIYLYVYVQVNLF